MAQAHRYASTVWISQNCAALVNQSLAYCPQSICKICFQSICKTSFQNGLATEHRRREMTGKDEQNRHSAHNAHESKQSADIFTSRTRSTRHMRGLACRCVLAQIADNFPLLFEGQSEGRAVAFELRVILSQPLNQRPGFHLVL